MEQPRNFKIEDVEFNWVKLTRPVANAFNKKEMLWEMQIATDDKAKADELKANHIPMKEKNGKFVASLRRKVLKADGTENGPVRVVSKDLSEFATPDTIGNGSRGNVIVFQYPWDNMGRKGIGNSLTAVQVIDHEIYTPSNAVGFDAVIDEAPEGETADPVSMF